MLELIDLHTFFGKSHVLQGVSLTVKEGEVVSVLGRNGAGKTTTLRSIMGIPRQRKGAIRFEGKNLMPLRTDQVTKLGLAYVPEDRRIFSDLTAIENLKLSAIGKAKWDVDRVFQLFPALADRAKAKGKNLSGGEQQMLAVGRALMTNPRVLLLDEPSQGLGPIVLEALTQSIIEIKQEGVSFLLVEQNLEMASKVADRYYVMDQGKVVYAGDGGEFWEDRDLWEKYLSV